MKERLHKYISASNLTQKRNVLPNCCMNNHAWQRLIKKSPVEKSYEKTEFENIFSLIFSG